MRATSITFFIGLGAGTSTAASAASTRPANSLSALQAIHAVPDRVEITVSPSVGDVELMDRWMQIASDQGMQAADVTAAQVGVGRTLVIEIGGSLLAYEYLVGIRTPDGWADPPLRATCNCRDQELIAHVREAIATLGPQLRGPVPMAVPVALPEPAPPPSKPLQPTRRMGPGGIAGATLVGIGAAAVIGGVVMLARPPDWSVDRERPSQEQGETLRLPGAIVAGVGVAIVVTGAALLRRDRTKRRATVAPTAGRRGFGVATVVRF